MELAIAPLSSQAPRHAEALLRRALGPVPMLIAALPRASSGNLAKASASSLGLTSG